MAKTKLNMKMLSPERRRFLKEQARRGNYVYGGWIYFKDKDSRLDRNQRRIS